MIVKTASWYTKLPPDHLRVGISRGVPRGMKAGYRKYPALNPGPWFRSVSIPAYIELYNEILAKLDARQVVDDLMRLADGKVPTLLCFEDPRKCAAAECWCHRHLVAQWLEAKLRIEVPEVDHLGLDRWARLRQVGIAPPSYR